MKQLEFSLSSPSGHRSKVAARRYRFTKDALVEELGDTRTVYGLWHRLFGCWRVNVETGACREILPTRKVLRPNGVWIDPVAVSLAGTGAGLDCHSGRQRFETNAAFAGFFSDIPQRYRTLVGCLGRHQWLALDLIWQYPEFARFLDQELFEDSRQYVFACFALARADLLSRGPRKAFVKSMMHRRRAEYLSEVAGVPCTRSAVRVLCKLGTTPHPARVYRAVLEALNNRNAAKALAHVDELAPAAIEALVGLPELLLAPNVIQILRREPASARILSRLLDPDSGSPLRLLGELVARAGPEWRRRTLQSLKRVRSFDDLLAWSERWEGRLTEAVRFPRPPVAAGRHLVPLSSAEAMRREALEMRNCLDALVPSVLEGSAYFFHWDGGEPATVMLERDPAAGWQFHKVLGFDNQPVDDKTDRYIRALVRTRLRARAVLPANAGSGQSRKPANDPPGRETGD